MRKNQYLYKLGLRELFRRHSGELLIIQAHPYRSNGTPEIEFLHGVEVFNGNPRHKNRNNKTRKLCDKHPGLCQLSASDTHETEDVGIGWMEFDRPIVDSFCFKELVKRGAYVLRHGAVSH